MMNKHINKNGYYVNRTYVYETSDPMAKIAEQMLKMYYAHDPRVRVFKWYHNDVVEITAKAA